MTAQKLSEIRQAQYVMGTIVEITAEVRGNESIALALTQRAMAEFKRLERMLSRHDPESELSRANREASYGPVVVSAECCTIISQGLEYSAQSGGCFSVTLAPLVKLWDRCVATQMWPDREEVEMALTLSDYRLIEVDPAANTIHFDRPGVALDFGGFAKGCAVDRAAAVLRRRGEKCGITRATINAGTSSFAVIDLADGGEALKIGLRHPADRRRLAGVLWLTGQSLSTSGTGESGHNLAGRFLSHLIDPRTGYPVERLASATVVCASAARAEVVSKMLLLLGCESGLAACDFLGWDVEGLTAEACVNGSDLRLNYSDALMFESLEKA
jgi:FAD:protein FMN transferase